MSKKSQWKLFKKERPRQEQRVVALYKGVSGPRVCTFYSDGSNDHFGAPDEGGSEPATHWVPLPKLP